MRRLIFALLIIPLISYGMDTLKVFPNRVSGNIYKFPTGTFGGGEEYYGDPRDTTDFWGISALYERNRISEGIWNIPDTSTEDTLGKIWWELPDPGLWGQDTSLGIPYDKAVNHMKTEGIKILHFPGASGRNGGYKGKTDWEYYDWQALIGPTGGKYEWNYSVLDTVPRTVGLGDTTLILPPRMQEYGFRQFITICDSVGAIALVPYFSRFCKIYPYYDI